MENLALIGAIALAGALAFLLRKYRRLSRKEKQLRERKASVQQERDQATEELITLCAALDKTLVSTTAMEKLFHAVNTLIDRVEQGRLPAKTLTERLDSDLVLRALSSRFTENVRFMNVTRLPHPMGLLVLHAQQAPDPNAPLVDDTLGGVQIRRIATKA